MLLGGFSVEALWKQGPATIVILALFMFFGNIVRTMSCSDYHASVVLPHTKQFSICQSQWYLPTFLS
eukprot:COSAG05_NODE_1340_length_5141_cov_2.211226_8_plen_67_part_00